MENNRNVWIIIAIVLIVAFFVMPWGGRWGGVCGMMGNYGSSYNYNSGWGMMSGGFGFGWIFMIIILVALVLLVVWLVQQLQKPKHSTDIENSRRRR